MKLRQIILQVALGNWKQIFRSNTEKKKIGGKIVHINDMSNKNFWLEFHLKFTLHTLLHHAIRSILFCVSLPRQGNNKNRAITWYIIGHISSNVVDKQAMLLMFKMKATQKVAISMFQHSCYWSYCDEVYQKKKILKLACKCRYWALTWKKFSSPVSFSFSFAFVHVFPHPRFLIPSKWKATSLRT